MTTIACKSGVMACDSCWTDGNDLQGTSMTKVIRLKSGALLGEAGDNDSRAVVKLLQSVKTFEQMPTALELAACCVDYAAIILFPNMTMAQILIMRHGAEGELSYTAQAWPVNRGCSAVGSGAAVAIGAMKAGRSAREAVAISCDTDPNSKLPVHTYVVETKPARKRGGKK
jgi:hypothetical protein